MQNKSLAFLLLTSVMFMPIMGKAQSFSAAAVFEKPVESLATTAEIKTKSSEKENLKPETIDATIEGVEIKVPEIKLPELKVGESKVQDDEKKNVVLPTLGTSENISIDGAKKEDIKTQETVNEIEKKVNFPLLKKPDDKKSDLSEKNMGNLPVSSKVSSDASEKKVLDVKEENKKRLEEELKTTTTTIKGREVSNFSNRSSLGNLELTTLPGLNETQIKGPIPMAESMSTKDLPSEQLLGRITPEIFQEMADIERGNTFLKLQTEKEKLKAELEKLKASYRQQRLDEISKREDVVRTRIKWWQEQENLRLEIEKKKAEEEMLNQQIAEQEATRDRLREEAVAKKIENTENKEVAEVTGEIEVSTPKLEELYTIESIRGLSGSLKAKLKDKSTEKEIVVQKDDVLPSGYVIKEVKKDSVVGAYGNETDQLLFRNIEE